MLDSDLAELYGVEVKVLNQAVKRNFDRFPSRFMFELNQNECDYLRSQFVTTKKDWNKKRYLPYAFTEQGVSMLSAILRSKTAIEVSIKIIDQFVKMRHFISQNNELFHKLDYIDHKLLDHDVKINKVLAVIEDKTISKKQGIFYDGQIFESHSFISSLIKAANQSIILLDNYVDDSVLTLFSERNKGVKIEIYTKNISKKLKLDLEKFNRQYDPIEIKEFNKSHDRFLIIDNAIYHIGASLKDLGKKWFAFSKLDINSYEMLNKLNNP